MFDIDITNVKSGFDEATLKPKLQATAKVTIDTETFMDRSADGTLNEWFAELGKDLVMKMIEI